MSDDRDEAVLDEAALEQMIALVGGDRIGTFLQILGDRLHGLGDLHALAREGRSGLTDIHKVVSEAGILGFLPLSKACRALEDAVKFGTETGPAADAAGLAVGDALAEIERRLSPRA